jgi:hypothetical protein
LTGEISPGKRKARARDAKSPVTTFRRKFFLVLLLGAAIAATSNGQTSAAVDRAELFRAQAQVEAPFVPVVSPNGVDDGHAAASPNDADLGAQEILKRSEEYRPFTVAFAAPFFYTSNVSLTHDHEVSDFLVTPAIGLFYQPRLFQTLYGLIDAHQQFFYYNRLNRFDFGSFDAQAGLTYYVPQFHNLVLYGRYDFNRLTFSDRISDDFFSSHSINLGAELPFRFGRAQQISVGGNIDVDFAADRESPRRNSYESFVGYSVNVSRWFSVDTAARVAVRPYYGDDRTDVAWALSAGVNYRLTTWWSASAISTFAANRSNHDMFDYDVANVGGLLSLSFSF